MIVFGVKYKVIWLIFQAQLIDCTILTKFNHFMSQSCERHRPFDSHNENEERLERNIYWKIFDINRCRDLLQWLRHGGFDLRFDWSNRWGRKKKRKFFSRMLSSLFFRSDWIRTEKKRKSYLAHISTTINKSRKKEEIEEKKERKKFLRSLVAFLYRRREEEKKIVLTYTLHIHTSLFPLSITTHFKRISKRNIRDESFGWDNYTYNTHVITVISNIKEESI